MVVAKHLDIVTQKIEVIVAQICLTLPLKKKNNKKIPEISVLDFFCLSEDISSLLFPLFLPLNKLVSRIVFKRLVSKAA